MSGRAGSREERSFKRSSFKILKKGGGKKIIFFLLFLMKFSMDIVLKLIIILPYNTNQSKSCLYPITIKPAILFSSV